MEVRTFDGILGEYEAESVQEAAAEALRDELDVEVDVVEGFNRHFRDSVHVREIVSPSEESRLHTLFVDGESIGPVFHD